MNHPFIRRLAPEPEHDRPGFKPAFDELVTGPVDGIHIERLDTGLYWMSITKGGVRQIVTFGTRRNALLVARTEGE